MHCYQIRSTLEKKDMFNGEQPYVIVMNDQEWPQFCEENFESIDETFDLNNIRITKAEVHYSTISGTMAIPDRKDIDADPRTFAYVLDKRGVVFLDNGTTVYDILEHISQNYHWHHPSLERFLYIFLLATVKDDLFVLEDYEKNLNQIEEAFLSGNTDMNLFYHVNELRGEFLDLRTHYEQLIDLSQVMEENENNFFASGNLRYFRLFNERVARLMDILNSLREYTLQVRDLYQSQLDVRQNRVMTLLTIVTTIFMPLTLIAGWYGMNFRYMPELESPHGYLVVIVLSVIIVVAELYYFKKKKLL